MRRRGDAVLHEMNRAHETCNPCGGIHEMNHEARSIPISYKYAIHDGVNREANHEVDES